MDFAAKSNLMTAKLTGYQPMLTPGKVRELVEAEWLGDNSGFTADTGWIPKLDLHAGVQQLFGQGG